MIYNTGDTVIFHSKRNGHCRIEWQQQCGGSQRAALPSCIHVRKVTKLGITLPAETEGPTDSFAIAFADW